MTSWQPSEVTQSCLPKMKDTGKGKLGVAIMVGSHSGSRANSPTSNRINRAASEVPRIKKTHIK